MYALRARYTFNAEDVDRGRHEASLTFGCIEDELRCYAGTLGSPRGKTFTFRLLPDERPIEGLVAHVGGELFEEVEVFYGTEDEDIPSGTQELEALSKNALCKLTCSFRIIFIVMMVECSSAKTP